MLSDLFGEESNPATFDQHTDLFKSHTVELSSGTTLNIRLVSKHVLWGNHIWNGGRWLADHFDRHPEETVRGRRVIELGAGGGLPSLVALREGAAQVILTDYPDSELIDNLRVNLDQNIPDWPSRAAAALGFCWGSSLEEIRKHAVAGGGDGQFDVVIMCDLVFNHSQHSRLLDSCHRLLKDEGGVAWCVFTHYCPWKAEKDLAFLRMAAGQGEFAGPPEDDPDHPEYGRLGRGAFNVEHVGEHVYDHFIFDNDRGDPLVRRTVHIYKLSKRKL